jgi:hypothetical protein
MTTRVIGTFFAYLIYTPVVFAQRGPDPCDLSDCSQGSRDSGPFDYLFFGALALWAAYQFFTNQKFRGWVIALVVGGYMFFQSVQMVKETFGKGGMIAFALIGYFLCTKFLDHRAKINATQKNQTETEETHGNPSIGKTFHGVPDTRREAPLSPTAGKISTPFLDDTKTVISTKPNTNLESDRHWIRCTKCDQLTSVAIGETVPCNYCGSSEPLLTFKKPIVAATILNTSGRIHTDPHLKLHLAERDAQQKSDAAFAEEQAHWNRIAKARDGVILESSHDQIEADAKSVDTWNSKWKADSKEQKLLDSVVPNLRTAKTGYGEMDELLQDMLKKQMQSSDVVELPNFSQPPRVATAVSITIKRNRKLSLPNSGATSIGADETDQADAPNLYAAKGVGKTWHLTNAGLRNTVSGAVIPVAHFLRVRGAKPGFKVIKPEYGLSWISDDDADLDELHDTQPKH